MWLYLWKAVVVSNHPAKFGSHRYQQMKIHVIIQLKKIQEFDLIQVLFKSSSIFQGFDWYNSHSQGEDVEWKMCIII